MQRERMDSWDDDGARRRDPRTAAGLRVAVYAGMAELVGGRVVEIPWSGGTVADLRAALATAHPRIAPLLSRSAVAVGNAYARDAAEVSPAADVAIIPPVSGG
ncbi:MAG: MoaD/ThiS family protein [Planctomycetia bacterium]|jgi:molybdopterin converting factor small subunit